jgi:hypothetical protein
VFHNSTGRHRQEQRFGVKHKRVQAWRATSILVSMERHSDPAHALHGVLAARA